MTVAERDKQRRQLIKKPLDELSIGQVLYIDLRWLNNSVYQLKEMVLTNKYERRWLFPAAVQDLSRNRCVATVRSTLMKNQQWKIDRRVLEMWAYTTEAAIPQPYTVLDKTFVDAHPYVRDLRLPADWDQLSDAEAANLMDAFTT